MIGMSAVSGRGLDEADHIRQSIRDILLTPVGTRVMRREYGSMLFALIDAPMDPPTILDIIQASAGAIGRWEPRVVVQRVSVADATPGHVTINLDLLTRATGAPIRLSDALADPEVIVRVTEDESIRVDGEGAVRVVVEGAV
ncbi:GPW/gp25 family protein [Thiocapsa sp.]|uniref:GPW/gp25 family protein n=1 Tax=Thiocapsa sp. TaxID=2024551 RepID=UPI0025FF316B|nr:GPW/gp25 family protein [Thiocapsa sp.]